MPVGPNLEVARRFAHHEGEAANLGVAFMHENGRVERRERRHGGARGWHEGLQAGR